MNKLWIRILCVISIIIIGSCGQWKVSTLKNKKLCTINRGSDPGNLMIDYNESGTLNLSFVLKVFGGKIYTGDNILKRIQVLDQDGTPLVLIGAKSSNPSAKKGLKQSNFNFSVIGSIAVDSNGVIYAQNRLMPSGNAARANKEEESDFSPSYILSFDKNGNLLNTIGQRGTPDIPFYYIENLDVDNKDRLFVISRSFDTWNIFRFSGKKRDFYLNLGSIDFKDVEGQDTYVGRIENVKIFESGENLLISVGYYHGSRFKYRKIMDYSIKNSGIDKTILTIPDPKNELFSLLDDKHIFLWNVENRKVKFVIYNFDGNVVNNVMVEMSANKFFEDILTDENGTIYTYHVSKKDIEVQEWK
jgi:hypothetical protein